MAAKKYNNKCITKWCRNDRRKGARTCHKCHARRYKENHPLRYYYNITKQSAKQRGKDWSLTLQQYEEFCVKTGYHDHRGRKTNSMTIDRIDPKQGYHVWNIRCLSHAENSARKDAPPDEFAKAYTCEEDDPF